jgi:acetolactate synthase I/II/III large subunit
MAKATAKQRRGADVVVEGLKRAGVDCVFALSGNHIMSIFDALHGSGIEIIHTRHEAACVHMADAYARLTAGFGVALVTGGQGFTNAAAGLPTALAADSPVLLLSGDTPTTEVGRGSFQELDQVAMSRPVTKQSMRAETPDDLGNGIARAISTALSGRHGPVHVALPSDLLDAHSMVEISASPFVRRRPPNDIRGLQAIARHIQQASRPILLAGPMFAHGRTVHLSDFERETRIPALLMESPRGLNDPSLGALAEVLSTADLIILAGKPLDFTLKFGRPPNFASDAQWVILNPDPTQIAYDKSALQQRVVVDAVVDADVATIILRDELPPRDSAWCDEVRAACGVRPAAWADARGTNGRLHPIELCRPIQSVIDCHADTVFISDGGEIGQWAQAAITARRRVINGVAGSIGASIPFALAARAVDREAPVIAVMGDGTFGFHMAEFDTAVRHNLPFVAVVGNDSAWNAEHQIQLRQYGQERAHGCTLLPTRYDQVVTALGGHGELVTAADQMGPALARAIASGKPACVNVMIESHAAPVIKRT